MIFHVVYHAQAMAQTAVLPKTAMTLHLFSTGKSVGMVQELQGLLQVLEKSRAFQAAWNRRLHLIGNDCRTHAAALAEHLVQGTYTKTKLL